MAMQDCSGIGPAFRSLVFDAFDTHDRCAGETAVLAFATLAALSFAAFVVIDVFVLLVRRYGFAARGAGEFGIDDAGTPGSIVLKAVVVLVLGAAAAWIVAFFAAIVEFVETAPQTAVATGVLWQVTYAQLLSRFGGKDVNPAPDGKNPPDRPSLDRREGELPVQMVTEEVAQ
jgi:hypothetical protein